MGLLKRIGWLGVGLLAVAVLVAPSAAAPRPAPPPPLFTWSVQERFAPDLSGRLPELQPEDVRRGPRNVTLTVAPDRCGEDGTYRWFANGRPIHPKLTVGCTFEVTFPRAGVYRVRLEALVAGRRLTSRQTLAVRDLVIVSIGDSVGSGESVPDVPDFERATWNSARCHRSGRASPALAARQLERADPHSSVTFVHLACSGATVPAGLRGHYAGAEPPPNEGPLPPQVDRLADVERREPIDAVILNVGANDVHFADVARFCARSGPDCFDNPFPGARTTTAAAVRAALAHLPGRYERLARDLGRSVRPDQVNIVQYFDPTSDRRGGTCASSLPGVTRTEFRRARTELLLPLNAAIADTRKLGWRVVTGVAERFRGHGYCAGNDASWITRLDQSFASLGGRLDGRLLGTLHPNRTGQREIADLVAANLAQTLLHRAITREPESSAPEAAIRELPALAILGFALGAALLVLAVAWLVVRHRHGLETLAVAVLALLGAVAIGVALFSGLDAGVARGTACAGGAAIGAAVVLFRLRTGRLGRRTDPRRAALIAVAVIASALAVAIVAFGGVGGLLLVAGVGAGIIAARSTHLGPRSLGPFRPAAPVLLPILAIGAVGTVEMDVWIPAVVGALLGFVAAAVIVRPELRGDLPELEWVLDKAEQVAVVVVLVALVVVAASKLLDTQVAWFEDRGGVPVALLLGAVVAWVLTIVLRLVGYATTRQRLIVAAALALLIARGLAAIGVIPGSDALRAHVPELDTAATIACAAVAVAGIAWQVLRSRVAGGAVGRWLDHPMLRPHPARVASGLGMGTALLASTLVAGAAIAGMVARNDVGSDKLPPDARGIAPEQPRPVIAADDGALADAYSPVLAFTEGERWAPVTVESYLAATPSPTRLLRAGAPDEHPRRLADLARSCPVAGDACWHLTIDCPEGRLDCADGRFRKRGDFERGGAVYARVLRRDRPAADGSRVFATVPPYLAAQGLAALVEYWYFYRYDEWLAPVLAGRLAQRHEGDWESVMVGLAADRPLFVAYSAHCGGSWRWWKDIHVSPIASPWAHPLVAVAEGSHANYPHAGAQSPNWTSCAGLPNGTEAALTYAANVRERTDYAWQWYPARRVLVDTRTLPMSFPGTWGLNDRSTLENFAHRPTSESGHGPKSPPLQPLWRSPLRTVFCNQYWNGPVRLRC